MSNYNNLLELYKNLILEEVYSQLLVEANLQTIKSNPSFNHNLSNEELDSLIDYDPFLYKAKDKETFNSPCIQWLVDKNQNVKKEEPSKVREILKKFFNYAKTGKIKNINPNFIKQPNDIQQYRMFKGIEQAVKETEKEKQDFSLENSSITDIKQWSKDIYKNLYNKQCEQTSSLENFGLEKDLKKVYNGKTVDIFQPLTYKGSIVLRCGSDMAVCIGDPETDEYYYNYTQIGDLLYIINKEDIYKNYAISIAYKDAKEKLMSDKEEYKKLKEEAGFEAEPNDTSLLEIRDKHDTAIIPYNFFFNIKPEVFEFLKNDKEWFKKLNLCMNTNATKEDYIKFFNKSLFEAIEYDDCYAMENLSNNITNIDYEYEDNNTLLIMACMKDSKNIVKFLLKKGADIEHKNVFGETPLINACKFECFDIVKLLLDKGANIEAKDKYNDTPLIFACLYENKEIVKLLLSKGANIEVKNIRNETPLQIAKEYYQDMDIVELLKQYGAKE